MSHLLILGVCAVLGAPASDRPAVLFHASFDRTIDKADTAAGSPDMVPQLYDRSALRENQGLADWQRHKDYKAHRAARAEDGRVGACLDVGVGKGHRFRALGNLNVRRGTVAFWVRFGRKLSTAHSPIFYATGAGLSLRVRHRTLTAGVGGQSRWLKSVKWAPDRWYHLAVVYDCTQGVKFYADGKRLPASRWGGKDHGWCTDALFADVLALAADKYRGSAMPIRFDELTVFSAPLAETAIARLAAGKALGARPATEPPAAPDRWRSHRLHELGWDLPGESIAAPPGATAPVTVRQVGVVASRDVKCWRTGAVDGVPATRWPTSYQGYEVPDRSLRLTLEPGARVDYLKLRGDFDGRVYATDALAEPARDQARAVVKSPGRFARLRLTRPIVSDTFALFAQPRRQDEKTDYLGRRFWRGGTSIHELGLFQVGDPKREIAGAEAVAYGVTGRPFKPAGKWAGWALASHFAQADRTVLTLTRGAGGDAARLPALRATHLFVPAGNRPTPLAGVRLRLAFEPLGASTRLRVEMRHPVDVTRHALDLDLELASSSADVTLDLQDVIAPAGRALWLTLTPERSLVLTPASRVDVLTRSPAEVRVEHVRNTLNYARDRFIHVSEPRPWSRVPLRECGERMLAFRQLDDALEDLHRHAPDDELVRGLWLWTHPKDAGAERWAGPPDAPGAPRWAVCAKECLKKFRAFAHWWIDNRQIPQGLFGSAYGDDTDLVNDWLSLGLICDPDARIRDSVRRLSDWCWRTGTVTRGVNRVHTDALHAYEEGVNTLALSALLHYGDPVLLERLMLSTRTVRDELMYELPGGRRHFKSWWYGATHIDTEFQRGMDVLSNALMLHPCLYLAYYSRNPAAVRLLDQWAGSWCDLQTAAYRDKQPVPVKVRYPTGEPAGTYHYPRGYGYPSVCMALHELTGQARYTTPMRVCADRDYYTFKTATGWLRRGLLDGYRKAIVAKADAVDWKPLSPLMGDDPRQTYAYMAWLATGEKRYVETALEQALRRISVLFPMHTRAEQSADRVAVSKSLVDRLYLGGTPGYRNQLWPMHAVSWSGFSDEFAAWVLQTGPDRLRVWIYNFEPKEQHGRLHVWGLDRGRYDVRFGADTNADERIDSQTWRQTLDLARRTPIALSLPARQLVVLEARQVRRDTPAFELPDLAVTARDMTFDAKTRKLTFVVHNIGGAPARDVDVAVTIDGRLAATHRVANLGAPIDLEPRTQTFTQAVPAGVRQVEIRIDPASRVPELCESNNQAGWRAE